MALKPKPRPAGGRGLLPGETEEDRMGESEAGEEVSSKTSSFDDGHSRGVRAELKQTRAIYVVH